MNLFERVISIARRKSPWICRLNAGSCNGCDIEITPLLSPRYDAEQLGIELHGTPKHADIVLISGTLTLRSRKAILDIYDQVPSPKAVVALGSCPATGNVFAGSPLVLSESLETIVPVDVWVPGCPPRPQAILDGIARAAKLLEDGATKSQFRRAS
ncbi:NADH-quinone oxidoreductase subunit B family protein [Azospirillum lipoferum]|uniref:Carbon monoxide-induced hydrogenase, CooL subunit n=1 Tax=Azospirillum lipoferum (strain 4B) TaxID=862719 RepID=G7ZGK6_AZOL4|nr:NADH-quinone oxidoreductase subunit NuoB [Azospirillum lipoferum]CBS90946.1 carbon monoxide-induced hydrogenase, CooL subunit [Azospirillum lipoferum 4B]